MTKRVALLLLCALAAAAARAADDGSQLASPFRINYLGYFQNGPKIALCLSAEGGALPVVAEGRGGQDRRLRNVPRPRPADFASGDSFFRIDFTLLHGPGRRPAPEREREGLRALRRRAREPLRPPGRGDASTTSRTTVRPTRSSRRSSTTGRPAASRARSGTTPATRAATRRTRPWPPGCLMNLYERYPEANASLGKTTLYEEVKVGSALMHQLILPGQKLAVAKLHTNVPAWGPCPPHEKGPCVSKTETKATYAMARTLAQLARVHVAEKQTEDARKAFALAKTAFANARSEPPALPRLPGLRRRGRHLPGQRRLRPLAREGVAPASRATPAGTTSRTMPTRPSSRCSWPAVPSATRAPPPWRVTWRPIRASARSTSSGGCRSPRPRTSRSSPCARGGSTSAR